LQYKNGCTDKVLLNDSNNFLVSFQSKQTVLAFNSIKEELKNNWLGKKNQHKVEMDIIAKNIN